MRESKGKEGRAKDADVKLECAKVDKKTTEGGRKSKDESETLSRNCEESSDDEMSAVSREPARRNKLSSVRGESNKRKHHSGSESEKNASKGSKKGGRES